MANGKEMLNDAQMENEIQEMKGKGELDIWTARQVYTMSKRCEACQSNSYSKKQSNFVIGVTAVVNAVWAILTSRFGIGGN